ncbi:MAG TPA: MBL fold metallo-hydrolase [Oscillospiraceae bacterium]|nr:MBL fold metallo-hydrolase [Oscillospiraceae bacterium]
MVTKVFDRIYSIPVELPQNPLRCLNSYFVQGLPGEKNLLIDTGFRREECRAALFGGLRELGADLRNTDLFLTHLHSDHTGLAPELQAAGCRIRMGRVDRDLLEHNERISWRSRQERLTREGMPWSELEALFTKNPAVIYAPGPFDSEAVDEGDVLSYGGYDFRAISAPGHTPGQMCLYDAANRLMILGDHVLFDITPNIISWEVMEDSLGTYLESLQKIAAYDVEVPLPAHRTTHGMTVPERVRQLTEHHGARLAETFAIVARGHGQTAYTIAGQMTWKISAKSWAEFPPGQKWFAIGEALSHLDYLRLRGKVSKEMGPNGCYVYEATGK